MASTKRLLDLTAAAARESIREFFRPLFVIPRLWQDRAVLPKVTEPGHDAVVEDAATMVRKSETEQVPAPFSAKNERKGS